MPFFLPLSTKIALTMGALVGGSVAIAANQDKIIQVMADVLQRGADQLNSHLEKRKIQMGCEVAEFEPEHLGAQTELDTDDGRESDDELYTVEKEPLMSSQSTVKGQDWKSMDIGSGVEEKTNPFADPKEFGDLEETFGSLHAAQKESSMGSFVSAQRDFDEERAEERTTDEEKAILSLSSSTDLSCGDFSSEEEYMVFRYRNREGRSIQSEDESWESLSAVSVD